MQTLECTILFILLKNGMRTRLLLLLPHSTTHTHTFIAVAISFCVSAHFAHCKPTCHTHIHPRAVQISLLKVVVVVVFVVCVQRPALCIRVTAAVRSGILIVCKWLSSSGGYGCGSGHAWVCVCTLDIAVSQAGVQPSARFKLTPQPTAGCQLPHDHSRAHTRTHTQL